MKSWFHLMGSAGFEPAASSAQGWHHTKLDNDPETNIVPVLDYHDRHNFKFLHLYTIALYTIRTNRN
jgi:hypothetical protein